jgi:dolichol-phosphate mannosyltransferase
MSNLTGKDRVVVIVPTYNESANIGPLLDAIFAQAPRVCGADLVVLVVDDRSPDDTARIVAEYSTRNANVHLLGGAGKRGLGMAYRRGFRYAMGALGADIVFEMDADFSHDPNDIPRLLDRARDGCDFVIGSRYVPGGSIPHDWAFWRKANSRWGNAFARRVAGLTPVRDCTSGYRAMKTSVLRSIDLDRLDATGYVFQISLLHAAFVNGAKIAEIPIDFADRAEGQSKLGLRDIVEFMLKVFLIRFSHRGKSRH